MSTQQNLFAEKIKKHGIRISLVFSMAIVLVLCILIVKVILSIDFRTLLIAAGEDLETDENNHTNFLILGTGNVGHDGEDLTDTILVTSLDQEDQTISMVSIPRDLFIEEGDISNVRINEIYHYAKTKLGSEIAGLEYLKKTIEELTGLPIQYYVKINFDGFTEIVDAIGGIDINVTESIYDPFYPKEGTIYFEPFSISAGQQHLDGETALKYARSRKTSSDFDRSERQQQIIYAVKEKALQTKTILNKDKLLSLLEIIQGNITTNLQVREMLTLGAIASDYDRDKIVNKLIHDDPVKCGGFLYTPLLENYGGAFVLIPAGGTSYLTRYFQLVTTYPQALNENLKIQVLNGTSAGGVAAENKQIFQRYCLNVSRFGNARSQEITQTKIYYKMIPLPKDDPEDETEYFRPQTIDYIKTLIPEAVESTEFPQEYIDQGYDKTSDMIVEIGSDYVNSDHYIEDSFSSLYNAIYAPPASASASVEPTETPTE